MNNHGINWQNLTSPDQLNELIEKSAAKPQLVFKHSTRCSISAVALNRLEQQPPQGDIEFWFLDLLKYRSLSNSIAETFGVYHESPQVLLIKNKSCFYDESHSGIISAEITDQILNN